MPPAGFETTVSAGKRPHTYDLDFAATATVSSCISSSSSSSSSSYHGVGPLVDPVLLVQNTSLRQWIQCDWMLGTVASLMSVACKIVSVISVSVFFFFLQNNL